MHTLCATEEGKDPTGKLSWGLTTSFFPKNRNLMKMERAIRSDPYILFLSMTNHQCLGKRENKNTQEKKSINQVISLRVGQLLFPLVHTDNHRGRYSDI